MSTESSETPELDNKKNNTNTDATKKIGNISGFYKAVAWSILIIVVYFTSSGIILYACKLAQSNILPTDINCSPYTEDKVNITPVTSNIFSSSLFDDPQLSMKINFPYNDKNKKNIFLDWLRKKKTQPKASYSSLYFISIIEGLIVFFNSSFNTVLGLLNEYIPEVIIVLFGPLLMIPVTNVIFILANVYVVILWITKSSWFFKRNLNADAGSQPKQLPDWKTITLDDSILSYLFSFWLASTVIVIGIIILIIFFPFISILPTITFLLTLFSALSYNGEITEEDNKKSQVGVGGIILRLIKYYKVIFMSTISFFITMSAFGKLGTIEGCWSIGIALLIFFGILTIDVFKSTNQPAMSGLVSNEQAMKTPCPVKEDFVDPKSGMFYKLSHPFKGGAQIGGKKLVNQLKKLSRQVNIL